MPLPTISRMMFGGSWARITYSRPMARSRSMGSGTAARTAS